MVASFPRRRRSRRAYTLVELLVVLGIIVLIAAITIPSISSVLRSYNLSGAAQATVGLLNSARQDALTGNQAVEVRFYELPDAVYPSTTVIRAVQAFQIGVPATGSTDTYTPLGKAYIFPTGIIVSSDTANCSTLFNTTPGSTFGISPLTPQIDTTNPLPPPYGLAPYYSFRFRPAGQTDLTPTPASVNGTPVSPILTIYSENAPIVANGLPANFVTIQIDVINGTVRSYQP